MERYPAWIEIDESQLRKNLRAIRNRIGKRLFCLPVKGDAYGHGAGAIARVAGEEGVDLLGVATLQEAEELKKEGVKIPIFLFGAIHEGQIDALLASGIEFTISSQYKAELVAKRVCPGSSKCRVHVEVDTGMQRTGVRPESLPSLIDRLEQLGCFEQVGIYSHLASSDVPEDASTLRQIECFYNLLEKLRGWKGIAHLANSGGVLHYPDSWFDMVRPGLLSYGYCPNENDRLPGEISPFLSLRAHISYFKVVEPGEGIGYGHEYTTQERSRIITIPVGYGDGYRRALWDNQAEVLIRGQRFPIAGRICMDQFMVNLKNSEAYVGEEVTLIGRQGEGEIPLWEIARKSNTNPYEVLCGLGKRLPRIFRYIPVPLERHPKSMCI
ncbi:MAG: alanine racemase [Verrucomicrobiota bacterium]|nr:alanine racemase [Verrucomicrobiota bacterium]